MLNVVAIQGKISTDLNFRVTPTGVHYCGFTLSIRRPSKPGVDPVFDVIPCVAWDKTADFINGHFKKGDMAVVLGNIHSRKYTTSGGDERIAYEVNVSECNFCQNRKVVNVGELELDDETE